MQRICLEFEDLEGLLLELKYIECPRVGIQSNYKQEDVIDDKGNKLKRVTPIITLTAIKIYDIYANQYIWQEQLQSIIPQSEAEAKKIIDSTEERVEEIIKIIQEIYPGPNRLLFKGRIII
jgi:hypothetical protein